MKRLFIDMFRYGIISVVALAVDFGLLMFLNYSLHVNYLIAATISFLAGLVVNYLLSHNRVFTDPKITSKSMNFIAFGSIGVIGLLFNNVIMWVSHDITHLSVAISKIIAVVIVFFWNFLARRQFLYQGHDKKGVLDEKDQEE